MEQAVLFVDDERNILNSLQRLFRKEGYAILTAESGRDALEIVKANRTSLVVSDHRMPEMDGVEFLSKVKDISPYTVRIILTGYADIRAVMAAVNRGEVYRYVTKPWDDEELKSIVRSAVSHYGIIAENIILQELTRRQNAELTELNRRLEAKVAEKTKKIKDNFFAFVRICANLLELYDPHAGSHGKRVAAMARGLALHMGLDGADAELIESAALLHNIGLVGVPKEIIEKDPASLLESEKALLRHNPVLSQDLLSSIDTLRQAGVIIRGHTERYDGSGYPDGLKKEEIHLGSRIIAVCKAFDGLRRRKKNPLIMSDALCELENEKGSSLDPEAVDAFAAFIRHWREEDLYPTVAANGARLPYGQIPLSDIKPGMALARDIVTIKGRLLVTRGTTLTTALIEKVQNFHRIDPIAESIHVLTKGLLEA